MNSRQRVIAAIEHHQPDRVPLDGDFRPEVWRTLRAHFETDDDEEVLRRLGIDLRRVTLEPGEAFKALAEPAPVDIPSLGCGQQNWARPLPGGLFEDEWGVRRRIGATGMYWHYVYHPLADTEDVDALPFPDVSDPTRYEAAGNEISRFRNDYIVLAEMANFFKSSWELRGWKRYLMDLHLNPSFVERLLERLYPWKAEEAQRLVEMGVDIIRFAGDVAMQDRMIISPDIWRRYFKPRLRDLIAETRRVGPVYFMFHSDGDMMPIMGDVVEIGFDLVDPVQPECMDPVAVKRSYGEQITLHGTLSSQRTLPFGSVTDVRREVRERFESCAQDGGFILAPSNMVQPDVPLSNLLTVYETAQA